jgi:amidase
MSNDVHTLSLGEVVERTRSGALSAEAVTKAMLARIEQLEPRCKAFASVRAERALNAARSLDQKRAAGEPLGPLHGATIGAKDLLFMTGERTASGTRVMKDYLPPHNATVVDRLVAAGAVIIGKTQLTEGAFAAHHPDVDPPKNPWNPNHWPGVSSSGSGVAVSARLCHGALGTDTGGSIRFPSAACGVVGLKPTWGRVSRFGAFELAGSLDHIGPMTRSVADAARILGVIAGVDPRDPTAAAQPVPDYLADPLSSLQGVRFAVDWAFVETGVDDVVIRAVRDVARLLESAGASCVEITMPEDWRFLVERWSVTCARETARAHSALYPSRKHDYGPVLAGLLDLGLTVDDTVYNAIEGVRARFTTALSRLLDDVDVLLCPNMVSLAPTVESMNTRVASSEERAAFTTFTAPFDYSGHPTLSLPTGLHDGLPTSVQLVARRWGEARLIAVGRALEERVERLSYP